MILNITYDGVSSDHEIDADPDQIFDVEVRRMGQEIKGLRPGAFDNFVVDRFNTPEGGRRFFLRPKVPFGSGELVVVEEGNTEFNEIYLEIKFLGFKVDSYSGSRKEGMAWAEKRRREISRLARQRMRDRGILVP